MKPFLKYALITCILLMAWALLQFATGIDRSEVGKYANLPNYIVMIIFIVLAMREERHLRGGYISFGEAFKTGFLMMLVVSVIMAVFTSVYFKYINPEFLPYAMEQARTELEKQGKLDDDEIDRSLGIMKIFMKPGLMTAAAFLGNIMVGVILSLIIAAFIKRKYATEQVVVQDKFSASNFF